MIGSGRIASNWMRSGVNPAPNSTIDFDTSRQSIPPCSLATLLSKAAGQSNSSTKQIYLCMEYDIAESNVVVISHTVWIGSIDFEILNHFFEVPPSPTVFTSEVRCCTVHRRCNPRARSNYLHEVMTVLFVFFRFSRGAPACNQYTTCTTAPHARLSFLCCRIVAAGTPAPRMWLVCMHRPTH